MPILPRKRIIDPIPITDPIIGASLVYILTSFVSRYRGQLEQEETDGNFTIVMGVKYWNTWTARLAFVIVFEVSQLFFLSRAHKNRQLE